MFGAGGHAKVVLDAARQSGLNPAMIVDDAPQQGELDGVPVRSASDRVWTDFGHFAFVVAIGSNGDREKKFELLRKRGGRPVSVVHPSAVIAPSAQLGLGTVCMAGVIVNASAVVGENCILNTAASVDHDCVLHAHVHLAPGVRLAGQVVVGAGVTIGLGAVLLPRVKVGERSIIGAGSVVNRPIPANVVAFGNPARIHRPIVPQDHL